ncbi:Putative kinase-like protein TMKL1 [Apostasia shenzhenica]|uniref:Kinase-like protein TMKL1 n=1 Tax=Apostasia shenzhenica TaxID=1088818 RepID=A0A2I0BC85_9ASPA|nr:Putative kinase-like protein TMKL1 [Apostasia shenzhenica]
MASSLFPLFLFACSLLSSASAVATSDVSESADVLLLLNKIKPTLQGPTSPENLQLSSWNASSPICLWRGILWSHSDGSQLSCDLPAFRSNKSLLSDPSIQVVSIHLPAAGLAGSLPRELGQLSYLRSLHLPVNSLTGPVPLELGNCPSLIDLDLAENLLNGSLPLSLWNLCGRLVFLRFHGNALSGAVPEPASPTSYCSYLLVLDLGSNLLEGSFPLFISGFRSLTELDLSGNHFSGPLPESLSGLSHLERLNVSYNNFSGPLPVSLGSKFGEEAFVGNSPGLCGHPLEKCGLDAGGLSAGAIAGIVIASMAGAVIMASATIGWVQGKKRRNRARGLEKIDMEDDEDNDGNAEGKLVVFEGGEHLTLQDVLNATGQVVEKTTYGTVYKAKLVDGGIIALRLLREGTCKDSASCSPVIRQLGRLRHENLVPLRAFYHGKRGEKLLIYDYLPNRSLHDLLHESRSGRPLLNWSRRHKIALSAARGLAYLHSGTETPITHGAIRSKNVFVDEFFVSRLAVYGIDKLMVPAIADEMVAAAKVEGYKAPELQRMKKSNSRTDVYAFGILLLEILIGKKPGKGIRPGEWMDLPALVKVAVLEEATMEVFDMEVIKGVRNPAEEGLVQALKLAMGCCAPVASVRPDMKEVVRILEENRPRNRSALYSPADPASEVGTPF